MTKHISHYSDSSVSGARPSRARKILARIPAGPTGRMVEVKDSASATQQRYYLLSMP